MDADAWRKCSTCKKPIPFSTVYYECSVSTCNRKRLPLFFCSVPCWDAHLPMMRHRDAWANEKRSPSREEAERAAQAEKRDPSPKRQEASMSKPVRRVVNSDSADEPLPRDILIVASKLKKYIKARSGMNTSDSVMSVLSDHVREICNEAIRHAAMDERKTVLDRDVAKVGSRKPGGET